jgi:hypothetical protein
MRRPLSIAVASLFVAALLAPTAQAASRRYWFDAKLEAGASRISVVVLYKNNKRHGRYTPRQADYDATVSVSCNPPVARPDLPEGAFADTGGSLIKLRKGKFTYSDIRSESYFSVTGTGTGKVLKKKPGVRKQMRVDGSVSVLDYSYPGYGLHNCTSGGLVPYSATPCRPSPYSNPPYIKKSLPVCFQG